MHLLNHDLPHEFPDHQDTLKRLLATDAHFGTLAGQFDAHNHAITRAEQGTDSMDEIGLEVLKKKRLEVKDEIYRLLLAG